MINTTLLKKLDIKCDRCKGHVELTVPVEEDTERALIDMHWGMSSTDLPAECYCPDCLSKATILYMTSHRSKGDGEEWHRFYTNFDSAYQWVRSLISEWSCSALSPIAFAHKGHCNWAYEGMTVRIDPIYVWPEE